MRPVVARNLKAWPMTKPWAVVAVNTLADTATAARPTVGVAPRIVTPVPMEPAKESDVHAVGHEYVAVNLNVLNAGVVQTQ